MHGRKKATAPLTPDEAAAISTKVTTYQKLATKLLAARSASSEPSPAIFELQAQLLKINPDFYTLWNHRKEMLLAQQHQNSPNRGVNSGGVQSTPGRGCTVRKLTEKLNPKVLATELELTRQCIRRQPKSYGAWHHRLWIVQGTSRSSSGASSSSGDGSRSDSGDADKEETGASVNLDEELDLCAKFLKADERNFHCWAYRMQVAAMAGCAASDELDFTRNKVLDNFSNYSAFHYRSRVLETLPDAGGEAPCCFGLDIVREELDMVVDAAFTEPYDQSAWWYHRFLLDWADRRTRGAEQHKSAVEGNSKEEINKGVRDEFLEILRGQVEELRGLVEMEDQCKWAHITLAQTIMRLRTALLVREQGKMEDLEKADAGEVVELNRNLGEHLLRLTQIDPQRAGFYAAMKEKNGL